MLSLPPAVRIFVARDATDLRKSFDALGALVPRVLGEDPFSGHVFCFFNRRRDRVKLLVWDRSGFWLFYKRLEGGRFPVPAPGGAARVEWTARDLFLVLEGIELTAVRQRPRYARPAPGST